MNTKEVKTTLRDKISYFWAMWGFQTFSTVLLVVFMLFVYFIAVPVAEKQQEKDERNSKRKLCYCQESVDYIEKHLPPIL